MTRTTTFKALQIGDLFQFAVAKANDHPWYKKDFRPGLPPRRRDGRAHCGRATR